MKQQKRNIQDELLNKAKQKQVVVTLFTTNGVKQEGTIKDFDNFTVVLQSNQRIQMYYKHAISTIIFGPEM